MILMSRQADWIGMLPTFRRLALALLLAVAALPAPAAASDEEVPVWETIPACVRVGNPITTTEASVGEPCGAPSVRVSFGPDGIVVDVCWGTKCQALMVMVRWDGPDFLA